MTKTSPIFSKLEFENAYEVKKNSLEIQEDLLNIAQVIENYKSLRKKEHMHKLKLKKILKEIKEGLKEIINSVPHTDGIKLAQKAHEEKHKEDAKKTPAQKNVQHQLEDIRRRLQELA